MLTEVLKALVDHTKGAQSTLTSCPARAPKHIGQFIVLANSRKGEFQTMYLLCAVTDQEMLTLSSLPPRTAPSAVLHNSAASDSLQRGLRDHRRPSAAHAGDPRPT